jgi:hypothetical protein
MTKITRGSNHRTDRYQYDFGLCSYKNGWAQLDTSQDASYYGNWIHPAERKLFSYCEGDTTLTECETDEEFIQEARACIAWHKDHEFFNGIDALCNEPMKQAFLDLGLSEFLH